MKKNGFVFMETIIVVAVLSITLVLLYSSYSYIIRKSKERSTYDTTETIYKTYYVKQIIDELKPSGNSKSGIKYFIDSHLAQNSDLSVNDIKNGNICVRMGAFNSYECDLSSDNYHGELETLKLSYEVEKIYYLNPKEINSSANKNDWLYKFDATTIDYIKSNCGNYTNFIMIVKYKKDLGGSMEVLHSSVEV